MRVCVSGDADRQYEPIGEKLEVLVPRRHSNRREVDQLSPRAFEIPALGAAVRGEEAAEEFDLGITCCPFEASCPSTGWRR